MKHVNFLTFIFLFVTSTPSVAAITYTTGTIRSDAVWSGTVTVKGSLVVEKGATLRILPGCRVVFHKIDADGDGVSETNLIVNGNIMAVGNSDTPIIFTSGEAQQNWGDWHEIQINHAQGFRFEFCVFEYAEYAVHIHFSDGGIYNSIFRRNGDATRIGNSSVIINHSLFAQNSGKALNFTNSRISFEHNTVRNNREGIFVFEKAGRSHIASNNIYDNTWAVKTGDFFSGTLVTGSNYWGMTPRFSEKAAVGAAGSPFIGALPALTDAYTALKIPTEGFVDGEAGVSADELLFPSFDGNIYIVNAQNGTYRHIRSEDYADAAPVRHDGYIVYYVWSGSITAVEAKSGKKMWSYKFNSSPKDDHRTASLTIHNGAIVAASPGGQIVVLNAITGSVVLERQFDAEFRATPLVISDTAILPSVNGKVVLIDLSSLKYREHTANAAFYASAAVYRDTIVLLDVTGKLFQIGRDLQSFRYLMKLDGAFRHQSPVVLDGTLYALSLDGRIFRIAPDLTVLVETVNEIFSATPVVYDGFIVAPCFSGKLFFYKPGRMFAVGSFGEIQFKPVRVGDMIYFGSRRNMIYAVKPW